LSSIIVKIEHICAIKIRFIFQLPNKKSRHGKFCRFFSIIIQGITGQACNDGLMKVFINDAQYFDNVPVSAWNFYIGGYQPAQKWLKDRRGRALNYDDIRHYQRIIYVLCETARIMGEIDELITH
jgi:hypothetical protein